MPRTITLLALATTVMLFITCQSNRKLTQENAEAAIRTFLATHNRSGSPLEDLFNVESITRVAPVSQFTENEASTVVKFKDAEMGRHPFAMKFIFRKNVDQKWFLTKLEPVGPPDGPRPGDEGWEVMLVQANQNMNTPVP